MSGLDALVGTSPGIAALRAQVERLVARPSPIGGRLPPVLILGETGTGKGLLVRIMHQASVRRDQPLIEINCAAIPEHLVEAELFGFERGAFTDARQAKPGLFQAARGGVLFLDEIGSLPLQTQAKLLKALEQREVRRLGSTRSEPIDVWILSATNEDLPARVARQEFRIDLYHRISTVTLQVPPLRGRGSDILTLANHFLERVCSDYGMPPKRLTPAAQDILLTYAWPGNVRELMNLVERAVLLAETDDLTPELLELPLPTDQRRDIRGTQEARSVTADRETLLAALEAAKWNLSRAAARLGVPRNTLRYRIERLGLRPGGAAPAGPESLASSSSAATTSGASGLRWEKRWITGLLARLQPPPSVSDFRLTSLLNDSLGKVNSFGGQLEELHPFGFTAIFGHEPIEDAPSRAALAAQAAQKVVESGSELDGRKVTLTTALHVAEALIARGASVAGMDLEDRKRIRQALQSLADAAPSGAIVVSADAAPFLERRFVLEPLAGAGYRLVGPSRSGFEVGGQTQSPFVGRDRELSQLDDFLTESEMGRGQVVGLMGEPGVGKSRLLHEFRISVGGDRVTYLEGRCAQHGSSTPYLPIIQLLGSAFSFSEADDSETIAERVRSGVNALGLPGDAITPYLLHLLGARAESDRTFAQLSPEAVRKRTVETLREVMIAASQQRPMIIAIEDVHWIDPTSADSLLMLSESVAACRILILTSYRHGYQPAWLGKSYASQLVLRQLSPRDSRKIVESIAPSTLMAPGVTEALVVKAEGIPFFLEELVRAVSDRPADRALDAIPGTIQGIITARIDRLPMPDQRLLQAAAVLGKDGLVSVLRELFGLSDAEFSVTLARLRVTEFLRETRVVPVPQYAFTHVLTQEVAYRNLSEERRQALHRSAAAAIEAHSPHTVDRMPEVLAHHLTEAGLAEPAISHWHRAGRLALDRSANSEAITHLTKALALLDTLPAGFGRSGVELRLQLTLSTAIMARRGYAAAELEHTLIRLRELTDELSNAPEIPFARFGLWRFAVSRADFATAGSLAHQLLTTAKPGDPQTLIPGRIASGVTAFYLGQLQQAREHFEHVLQMHEPKFAPAQIARNGQDLGVAALSFLGWTVTLMGEMDRGAKLADQAIEQAQGHPLSLAVALNWANLVRCERHELEIVRHQAEKLLALSQEQGFAFFSALAVGFLGWARFAQGDHIGGADLLRQGYDRYLAAEQRVGLRLRAQFAEALVGIGSIEEALTRLDEFFAHSHATGERGFLSELYRIRGEALGRRSPQDPEAEACLEHAINIAREQGASILALRAATSLVRLQRERGGPVSGLTLLRHIHGTLTEGLDLHHPLAAKALLEE